MVLGISRAALIGAMLHQASTAFAQTNGTTCNTPFTPISAAQYFGAINPGWNLGNTLDAIETEGSWNNPPVVASTFDDIKAAGFKSIRLPVTWAYHFKSQAPDYTVDPVWLQRVSDVLDMITSRGLYAVVNVHHDSWVWADYSASGANVPQIEDKFYKLWVQIGTKLACKSQLVAFEPINEPPGTTAEHGAEQNKLNDLFLKAINEAGGHNPKRVVTLVGSGQDGAKTSQWFEPPNSKWKNPWGIQYHYYSPYDFVFGAWGKTTWGSDADVAALDNDIASVRRNFTDIPLMIGEWQCSSVQTETAARWRYIDTFVRTAAKYNTSTMVWDNGADCFNRATKQWRDEIAHQLLLTGSNLSKKNTLPDSTTDGAATTQSSSAYIYHKANTTVSDAKLPFRFNGNTLSKISDTASGKALVKGKDYQYTAGQETITITASYLSTILTPTAPLGTLRNLTLTFSSGSPLRVNILKYTQPTLSGASSQKIPASSADILIPMSPWPGHNRPAAVRAVKSDGTFLVDDWTQYLGPLQQGRMTYSGQWDWDGANVILRTAVVDAVRAAGKDTTFTVEFYPREPGNAVNYTLTV